MESKNLVGMILAVTVGLICVGSVLSPSISDIVSGNTTTYTNEGTYYYDVDPDEDRVVITSSSRNLWTMNGETYDVTGVEYLITTDQCRVHLNGGYLQLFDETGSRLTNLKFSDYLFTMTYDLSEESFTLIQYADLTTDTVSATYTYDISHIIIYNPDGDYVAFTSEDGTVAPSGYYVNSLSEVICGGAYTSGDLDTSYYGQGETVVVGNTSYTASATATTENVTDDVLTVSDYTVTVTDGTTTETFIPYTIYVPETVVGHTSSQFMMNGLFEVISVLVILGVLMVAVRGVTRYD